MQTLESARRAVNPRPGKRATAARVLRQPLETRRRILSAASLDFAARGLAGARVDQIARRAGVSKRMLYHYFGNKEALWLAVLEQAYAHIRGEERLLDVGGLPPVEGMRRLIAFSVGYCRDHPEFLALLNSENLHRAKYLRRSKQVRELHTSLLGVIADLLARGQLEGAFRNGVDAAELYIAIAALGYFYFSNLHTLSVIFGRDFGVPEARRRHVDFAVDLIMGFLRP
jgi:TetR/AcrR family transcriptional regulator